MNITDSEDLVRYDIKPAFVWVDIETNGLPQDGVVIPLEIGIAVSDVHGNIARTFQRALLPQHYNLSDVRDSLSNEYVREMHSRNGLWNTLAEIEKADPEVRAKHTCEAADKRIVQILEVSKVLRGEAPMAGSTISFDRTLVIEHFPLLQSYLHHRNIDISSIKELCRRLNPSVYGKRPQEGQPGWVEKEHRPVADIKDSINEYRFYKENFLFEE